MYRYCIVIYPLALYGLFRMKIINNRMLYIVADVVCLHVVRAVPFIQNCHSICGNVILIHFNERFLLRLCTAKTNFYLYCMAWHRKCEHLHLNYSSFTRSFRFWYENYINNQMISFHVQTKCFCLIHLPLSRMRVCSGIFVVFLMFQ